MKITKQTTLGLRLCARSNLCAMWHALMTETDELLAKDRRYRSPESGGGGRSGENKGPPQQRAGARLIELDGTPLFI
jgi:hypothetical protein